MQLRLFVFGLMVGITGLMVNPPLVLAALPADLVKSAEQGSAKAQVRLGNAYQRGRGVKQDYQQAAYWYEQAAEQGYARGQRPLGALYEQGLGVPQDYEKAAHWYRAAAEQGLARAQVNLGVLYEHGLGVPQDYDQAFYWYDQAARQSYGRALNHLGLLFEKGLGRAKDLQAAGQYYTLAAAQGYSKGMLNLGNLYEKGSDGFARDVEKARFWYEKAVAAGYYPAGMALAKLEKEITAAETPEEIPPAMENIDPEEKKPAAEMAQEELSVAEEDREANQSMDATEGKDAVPAPTPSEQIQSLTVEQVPSAEPYWQQAASMTPVGKEPHPEAEGQHLSRAQILFGLALINVCLICAFAWLMARKKRRLIMSPLRPDTKERDLLILETHINHLKSEIQRLQNVVG